MTKVKRSYILPAELMAEWEARLASKCTMR